MSRSASGTYSLPAGNPVVTGTTVASATNNNTVSDIATELTDSLSRSNKGAMLAALTLNAGAAVGTPDLTWTGDTDTGLYRVSANTVGMSSNGAKVFEWAAAAVTSAVAFIVATVKTITANASVTILGNRDAADTGSDVVSNSTNTRTAGNIHDFQNNTVSKLKVDFAGQLKWPSGPASTATTPAPSAVTALTLNANWTSTGAAYWKDPCNIVHLRGNAANNTGGANSSIATTTPLPAGFRPSITRAFTCTNTSGDLILIQIAATGGISTAANVTNTHDVWLDGINFLADA